MKRLVCVDGDAADDAPITLCHKNRITIGVAQEHKESFAPWVAATGAAVPRPPLQTLSLFSARCRLPRTSLWMNRLPAGEHFHKPRDPLGARFSPFGIV